MHIELRDAATSEVIGKVEVSRDAEGFIHAQHPTFPFEVECALYCYNEGNMLTGSVEDDNDKAYVTWSIIQ